MGKAYKDRVCEDDIWARWPNDFMCPHFEIAEHIERWGFSADYELVEVLEYDETDEPCKWQPHMPAKGATRP